MAENVPALDIISATSGIEDNRVASHRVALKLNGRELPERVLRSLTEIFRSLADRSRLMILLLLAERGEMNVSAIGEALEQSQPAVSHHLMQLRNAGFIDFRRDGKYNFYKLAPDGFRELIAALAPDGQVARLTLGGMEVTFTRR